MQTMTSPRSNYHSSTMHGPQKIQKAVYYIKILCDANNIMQTLEATTDEVSPCHTPTQYRYSIDCQCTSASATQLVTD